MKLMTAEIRDGALVLGTPDRIDTSNAPGVEEDINEALALPHTGVTIDADDLRYISSSGLRAILRLRKLEPTLRMINVSTDVYDVLEMTGFTEMIEVEKAFRRLSVDGCPVIGRGAKGTVYRFNPDTAVKVFRNQDSLPAIRNERELARRAFVLGIPTAIPYDIVRVGDSYGSVFELLDADCFSALIARDPGNMGVYVKEYAELLRQIHKTNVKPEEMPDVKPFILSWMDAAEPFLEPGEADTIRNMIRAVPDTTNMLHCDYHTNNTMMQNGEIILIDMDSLSHGHPVFELANIYITYVGFGETDPAMEEAFLGMPYQTAVSFWKQFLPLYLGTDDEDRIRDVEDKARLLAACRYLRHIGRRGTDGDIAQATIAHCKATVTELLATLDHLDF